jgi:hypothetical protein
VGKPADACHVYACGWRIVVVPSLERAEIIAINNKQLERRLAGIKTCRP